MRIYRSIFYSILSFFCISYSIDNTIHIAQLHPDRWSEYRELMLECLKLEPQAMGAAESDVKYEGELYWRAILEQSQEAKNRLLLFAFSDNKVVGTAGAIREEGSYCNHCFIIRRVYVSPPFRGHGIGTLLMEKLCECLSNDSIAEMAYLWVTKDQVAAIKLYTRSGFKIMGVFPKSIKVGQRYYDDYLMVKDFKADEQYLYTQLKTAWQPA